MREKLKKAVKPLFVRAGFEVVRRNRHRLTQGAFFAHVRRLGFCPGTVIDVGVAYGTPELYSCFPEARLLLVEPLEEFEPFLKELERKRGAEYVLAAAGAKRGALNMNVRAQALYASSQFADRSIPSEPREVPVVTLDALLAERNLPVPYLIKVDVQGAELEVISGARQALEDTELVLLEVSLFGFYGPRGPQFADVVDFMKKRNFVVYDITGKLNRPADDALAQVDVAFIKEGGVFRRHHRYA